MTMSHLFFLQKLTSEGTAVDSCNFTQSIIRVTVKQRTSLHKGVLVVPEYFNNILVTYSHIKGTCNGGKFELNGLLVL